MRNKVSSQTRLESSVPCSKCGDTTVEVINFSKEDEFKMGLRCASCDNQIKGNSLFELLSKWEEENTKK